MIENSDNLASGHTFVVDLTRHIGDAQNLIISVTRHIKSKFPTSKVTWFARPDQAGLLRDYSVVVDYSNDVTARAARVKDLIVEMAQNGSANTVFHVLTYERWVLAAAASLNEASLIVVPMHLASIKDRSSEVPHYAAVRPSPHLSIDPLLDDAIRLTQTILAEGGHTSPMTALPLAKLRPVMSHRDPGVRKNPFDPVSVSLITRIVKEGENQGWLKQFRLGTQTGTERIWLCDTVGKNGSDEAPALPVDLKALNVTIPHEELPTSYVGEQSAATLPATQGVAGNGGPPARKEVNTTEPVKPELPLGKPRTMRRSDIMESKLQDRGVWTSPIARHYLFEALSSVLAGSSEDGLATAQLIGRATETAKQDYQSNGGKRALNWRVIGECFLNMTLAAGVLLRSDGTKVLDGIGAYSATVAKVEPDFRDRCEAFLLETIIKNLDDVTYQDCYSLGLALFQRGKEDEVPREVIVERTDSLLRILEEAGRISVDQGRIIAS